MARLCSNNCVQTLCCGLPLWQQLFPAEQAHIIQWIVKSVTVTAEGLVIDMRIDGIAGVMREMMTPRKLEAAE